MYVDLHKLTCHRNDEGMNNIPSILLDGGEEGVTKIMYDPPYTYYSVLAALWVFMHVIN